MTPVINPINPTGMKKSVKSLVFITMAVLLFNFLLLNLSIFWAALVEGRGLSQ